ncbi:phage repressor protein CI [Rosenbergiella epipactidis]|uniref:phage repressor protein CI n=1 Tax=Rosenbergiella epipactidis TaxID=1544694 RepID=UPI001F4EE737|nr:phage repressor protein CI [Rosenbergiella epipactidis]
MSNTSEIKNVITPYNFPSQKGGREAITRILEAYGFNTRQALCDHLGVSQSTMANRWMRDTFPHDWLIACHLDTGISLHWLTTGEGTAAKNEMKDKISQIGCKEISKGVFSSVSMIDYDLALIPYEINDPFIVKFENSYFLIDDNSDELSDGFWLISVDGFMSVREVFRIPGNRLRIENGKASYECNADEVSVVGCAVSKTEFLR